MMLDRLRGGPKKRACPGLPLVRASDVIRGCKTSSILVFRPVKARETAAHDAETRSEIRG